MEEWLARETALWIGLVIIEGQRLFEVLTVVAWEFRGFSSGGGISNKTDVVKDIEKLEGV